MTIDDDGTSQAIESFYKIHRTNWTEAYSNACETKPSCNFALNTQFNWRK